MKKIININLSGRVIPIEDAAYESLQRYIESLRRYFANEEGRDEIINDIESRVAELMNDKIKKGSAAVTEADINEIVNSMGRVEDFEQADAADAGTSTEGSSSTFTNAGTYTSTGKRFKGRLYRDSSDKILGGVCSGIANYLNVDPAIVRLLFAIITFGGFGFGVLVYILLWIIIPSRDLDNYVGKRLFRNPEDRIIGGVAGGLAAYFNKEAWVIRLIFAAPLLLNILVSILNGIFGLYGNHAWGAPDLFFGSFTGTFILAYIILWIVLPEARSPFEKMEMRGEKVDVNSIKQNVQEGMGDFKTRAQGWSNEVKESVENLGKRANEFANTRGKTFATEVGQTVKPVASGLGHAIGVLFKAFFLFVFGALAFALFVLVLVFTVGGVARPFNDFILNGFWQNISLWGTLIFFLAVPLIGIITWIVRRLMKIRSQNRYLGWTFGGLWTLGWISLFMFITLMAKDWRYYKSVPTEVAATTAPINKMTLRVDEPEIRYSGTFDWINDDGDENGWDLTNDSLKLSNIKIRVDKSADSNYHVTLWKYSAGKNRNEAEDRAQKIEYSVTSMDSVLLLGSGFGVSKDQKFRGQKVIVEIKVPVGKQIRFDGSLNEKLNPTSIRIRERDRWNNRRDWDIDWDDDSFFDYRSDVDYTMTESGELKDATQLMQQPQPKNEVYEYKPNNDSLRRSIEERERQLEEDKRRLQEAERTGTTNVREKKIIKKASDIKYATFISSPVFSLTI